MSLSEQNNQRENNNHRPRNHNRSNNRPNQRQWVPRSSIVAQASTPSVSVDIPSQSSSVNGGASVNDISTCGQRCDKLLDCGRHMGPCDPCEVVVNASCFCKKLNEAIFCGDMAVKGEVKVDDGVFSCSLICEKMLSCGNHLCHEICHPGPCGECSDQKSVLTCGQRCDKLLDCGRHMGPCDPCEVVVNASCFCKKLNEVIFCGDMAVKGEVKVEDGVFSCSLFCEKMLSCGNHLCNKICHPGPCEECEL